GGLDDLFGDTPEPAADASDASSATESLDDLFGDPDAAEDAPASEAKPADDAADNLDDLFGKTPAAEGSLSVQVVSVAPAVAINPLDETHVRTWIDNTGKYQVEGRLIEINTDNVRLLKSNGRTCTVPAGRLCPADESYVDSIRDEIKQSRLPLLSSK
uniref:SHD1 domain-containing protein n=1 Tax=Stieleria sp. TaxID=2795976 RepID=UPI0035654B2E